MSSGNIYVKFGNNRGIYLHTKLGGPSLPKTLKAALVRGKARWGDTATLSGIIFNEMTQKDTFKGSGFSMNVDIVDNDNFVLVVDDHNSKVGIFGENGRVIKSFSFNEFISLSNENLEWPKLTHYFFADYCGVNQNRGDPYPFT